LAATFGGTHDVMRFTSDELSDLLVSDLPVFAIFYEEW
jgi:hypothetical protein